MRVMGQSRDACAACLAAALLFAMRAPCEAAEPASREHEIKAALIYNFTKFVKWPEGALGGPNSPIVIGVLCPTTFVSKLSMMVANRKTGGRPLAVRALSQSYAASVHLVFVCATDDARFAGLVEVMRGRPVVTIGETAAFAERGGMVTLRVQENRVRFDIDMRPVRESRLQLSARLERLARAVRT